VTIDTGVSTATIPELPHPRDASSLEQFVRMVVTAMGDERITDMELAAGKAISYQTPRRSFRDPSKFVLSKEDLAKYVNGLPQAIVTRYNEHCGAPGRITINDPSINVKHVRIQLWRSDAGAVLTLRLQPRAIPRWDQLGGPSQILDIMRTTRQGMMIFTGPVRSGKTWLQHAGLEWLNENGTGDDRDEPKVIVIGDPPEFSHDDKSCIIHSREIGFDTPSYEEGIHDALRSNPRILMCSELRGDVPTSRAFLRIGRLGCFAMSAMHQNAISDAINIFVNPFEPGEREDVKAGLQESLVAIVNMRVVPNIAGTETLVTEFLTVSDANRGLLVKPRELRGWMQGKKDSHGCWVLEDELVRLSGTVITPEVAKHYATDPRRLVGVA
jgi:twitching motility protein PilT